MKKMLVMLLAMAMVFSCISVTAFADRDDRRDKDEDWDDYYDNQDVFDIKENTNTLSPGVDYYFDCTWQGGPVTDEFFEFYNVSVSVNTPYDREDKDDDGYISSTTAKKIAEAAGFVKLGGQDKYAFHFRAKQNFSYPSDDEVTIKILVTAKDKSRNNDRDDSRSWVEFELDIGYADKNKTSLVDDSSYEVENDEPVIEFDEDLDSCKLTFEDGSYFTAYFDRVRKFNLGQTKDANAAIVAANPGAKLDFVAFYAKPSFIKQSVLKLYVPGCSYLYEINENNKLELLVNNESNNGYIGHVTSKLGFYVASDRPLNAAAVSNGNYVNQNVTDNSSSAVVTPAVPSAPSQVVITNPMTGAEG